MKDYLDTKTDIVWCRFMDRYKYMQHCDTIKKELESLRQKKKDLADPKSPNLEKVAPTTSSGNGTEKQMLMILSKERDLEEELHKTEIKIIETDRYLDMMKNFPSEYCMCDYKFKKHHTWYETEEKFYLSRRAMEKRIKKVLKKLLQDTSV
ncbi:hypothetical protein [Absicoccus intestinalis]|uniref:Transcriptional regulator n=1 Tax=Absicoccus intestinalis TaxID=2926319 RepID=A0ABU4WPF0_9FIRM|nr:hypothetical protein [Absicoccus sp. CLA-KB-P134]MDX8417385.1 hypothetical protein [Absicoccus sp. CLA-KB-P134]